MNGQRAGGADSVTVLRIGRLTSNSAGGINGQNGADGYESADRHHSSSDIGALHQSVRSASCSAVVIVADFAFGLWLGPLRGPPADRRLTLPPQRLTSVCQRIKT